MIQTGHVVFAVALARAAARLASRDSRALRRLPAWIAVMVMPWPKVGLKLTTASPNGMMPAGKRFIWSYRRHRLVGYLWNATSPMGVPRRIALANRSGRI